MATTKSKAANDRDAAQDTCIHYWVIDSPEGPTSRGICKLCDAEHEFNNCIPYPSWHDTKWKDRESSTSEIELIKASSSLPEG